MNRDYNFNKFAGIQPATREALNWIFENGGLPLIKGRWFFVDPDNGSASASGDADAPVSNISYAYALCTSGAGDGIVLLSGGTATADTTSYLDQQITWSKHAITVVGIAAPTRMYGRARIANVQRTTGALTTISFTNSGTADYITDSAGGFLTAGFAVGQKINVDSTSNTNDGQFTISAVTASRITLSSGDSLTTEAAATAGATTITTYSTCLIEMTGDNNAFYNVHMFNGGSNALEVGCLKITGNRNYFGSCHFVGAGHATPAATTGAYDLMLDSGEENTFMSCTFGTDTIIRAAANGNIVYDNGCYRNRFYDCDIVSYSATSGKGAIKIVGVDAMQYVDIYSGCRIINWNENGYTAIAAAVIGDVPTSGHILFDNCSFFGYTAIGVTGTVYVGNCAAVASGAGGIATTP